MAELDLNPKIAQIYNQEIVSIGRMKWYFLFYISFYIFNITFKTSNIVELVFISW